MGYAYDEWLVVFELKMIVLWRIGDEEQIEMAKS